MSISISGNGSFTGANSNYNFDQSVGIAGTLTYEDVTNIDSVGIITARQGLDTPTNLVLRTGGTERVRIDSNGKVLVGTDTNVDDYLFQVDSSSFRTAQFTRYTSDGATVVIGSSRGTQSSKTSLNINDYGGLIEFKAYEGSDFSSLGRISGQCEAAAAVGDTPGRLVFWTTADGASSPTERMRIDSSGRVGIGVITMVGGGGDVSIIRNSALRWAESDGTQRADIYGDLNNNIVLRNGTGSTERMRIDSSGRLLIGTSSAATAGQAQYGFLRTTGNTLGATSYGIISVGRGAAASSGLSVGNNMGTITFTDSIGAEFARIQAATDGTTGTNDYPGNLRFYTTADGASSTTERMRIDSSGSLLVGRTSAYNGSPGEVAVFQGARHGVVIFQGANANYTCLNIRNSYANNGGNNVSGNMITFHDNGGTERGKITTNGSSTSYITSSDYRLKENVVDIADGINRVKQLQPKRFNFIVDPGTTVDGFLAHETQTVVPEAITGTKDEVDDDGNAVMQGIDQAKLVPLLTAALQEAITKIETLEAKVQALEES
jgi:hypothetical protein